MINDLLSKSVNGNFVSKPTRITSTKAAGSTTLRVESTSGMSTTTPIHLITYSLNPNNSPNKDSFQTFKGVVGDGTTITDIIFRGNIDGSAEQNVVVNSTTDSYMVVAPTDAWLSDLIDGIQAIGTNQSLSRADIQALIDTAEANDVESVVEAGGVITVTKHDGSTNIITLPQVGGGGATQGEINALIAQAQRNDILAVTYDEGLRTFTFVNGDGSTSKITISAEDSSVEANPSGTDGDTLVRLGVDGSNFNLTQGSEVTINPAGESSQTATSIGIDGTKYGLPQPDDGGVTVEANPAVIPADVLTQLKNILIGTGKYRVGDISGFTDIPDTLTADDLNRLFIDNKGHAHTVYAEITYGTDPTGTAIIYPRSATSAYRGEHHVGPAPSPLNVGDFYFNLGNNRLYRIQAIGGVKSWEPVDVGSLFTGTTYWAGRHVTLEQFLNAVPDGASVDATHHIVGILNFHGDIPLSSGIPKLGSLSAYVAGSDKTSIYHTQYVDSDAFTGISTDDDKITITRRDGGELIIPIDLKGINERTRELFEIGGAIEAPFTNYDGMLSGEIADITAVVADNFDGFLGTDTDTFGEVMKRVDDQLRSTYIADNKTVDLAISFKAGDHLVYKSDGSAYTCIDDYDGNTNSAYHDPRFVASSLEVFEKTIPLRFSIAQDASAVDSGGGKNYLGSIVKATEPIIITGIRMKVRPGQVGGVNYQARAFLVTKLSNTNYQRGDNSVMNLSGAHQVAHNVESTFTLEFPNTFTLQTNQYLSIVLRNPNNDRTYTLISTNLNEEATNIDGWPTTPLDYIAHISQGAGGLGNNSSNVNWFNAATHATFMEVLYRPINKDNAVGMAIQEDGETKHYGPNQINFKTGFEVVSTDNHADVSFTPKLVVEHDGGVSYNGPLLIDFRGANASVETLAEGAKVGIKFDSLIGNPAVTEFMHLFPNDQDMAMAQDGLANKRGWSAGQAGFSSFGHKPSYMPGAVKSFYNHNAPSQPQENQRFIVAVAEDSGGRSYESKKLRWKGAEYTLEYFRRESSDNYYRTPVVSGGYQTGTFDFNLEDIGYERQESFIEDIGTPWINHAAPS